MSYRLQLAELDLGNLLIEDKAPLDITPTGEITEELLHSIAEECTRHFLRKFWTLPTNSADGVTVSLLPKPTFRLPREKRIPAQRDLTRWERFAQLKGIKNKKKSRKVWDPETQSWKPRWGKDRVDSVKDKWVIEVPENADPYEDQFAKLAKERNERRAKNEFQRLRNIARSVKPGQAPPVGVLTESHDSKNELTRALSIAKVSDASLGRFAPSVNEKKLAKQTKKKFDARLKLSQVVDPNVVKQLRKSRTQKKDKNKSGKTKTSGKKKKKGKKA